MPCIKKCRDGICRCARVTRTKTKTSRPTTQTTTQTTQKGQSTNGNRN